MPRALIILGVLLIVAGLTWRGLSLIRLGHLPGDIVIERQNFTFYIPITTCLLISAIASLLWWLFRE
jgi:hypothetical protein